MGSRGYVFRYPLEPNDRGDRWVLGGTEKRTHLIKSTNIKARYVFRYPLEPNDRCDRWVLGGTEKRTPWNPSVPHTSGLQKPMISISGPAGPLRFGVQTPSKPHDRCDRGVLGGTEKRTPWNPSVPQSGLAVWPLFLKALSANRSPSKLQGTFNNVFHSLFMELCSKFIVVNMNEQNKTLKRSVPSANVL